jgi:hypothetical protein
MSLSDLIGQSRLFAHSLDHPVKPDDDVAIPPLRGGSQ